MLTDGVIIMIVGITTVFLFLGIMVVVVEVAGKIMQAWALRAPAAAEEASAASPESNGEIAAAVAAVKAYTKG